MLQKVADAKSEEVRTVVFADVQELVTNAQWATDEGDFGETQGELAVIEPQRECDGYQGREAFGPKIFRNVC